MSKIYHVEYVKFETARLANKKGYNPPISSEKKYWDLRGKYIRPYLWFNLCELPTLIHAPTQSELQKWVRVELSLHIEIYCYDGYWGWDLIKLYHKSHKKKYENMHYESYENALEAGLTESLK